MAQTERDQTAVRTLLADNTTADISPEDLRDAMASAMGYGCMVLSAAGAPAVMSAVGTTFELFDVFDTIHAQSSDVNTDGTSLTLSSTYDFTIGATGIYRTGFWASFSSDGTPTIITFRPHINASPGAIEVVRSASSSDVGVVSFEEISSLTAGDLLDMRVKIDTGTADLSFNAAGCLIHRVG